MSKTNRAGCQNTACKKEKIKIQKDELRMGSLVIIQERATWMWKHWLVSLSSAIQLVGISWADLGLGDVSLHVKLKISKSKSAHLKTWTWTKTSLESLTAMTNSPGKPRTRSNMPWNMVMLKMRIGKG